MRLKPPHRRAIAAGSRRIWYNVFIGTPPPCNLWNKTTYQFQTPWHTCFVAWMIYIYIMISYDVCIYIYIFTFLCMCKYMIIQSSNQDWTAINRSTDQLINVLGCWPSPTRIYDISTCMYVDTWMFSLVHFWGHFCRKDMAYISSNLSWRQAASPYTTPRKTDIEPE